MFKRKISEDLELDEIFFDKHQLTGRDIKWADKLEKPVPRASIRVLSAVIFIFLLITLARSAYFSLIRTDYYLAKAESNYIKEVWDFAPRGVIYDTRLKPLAQNESVFNLVAVPAELPRDRKVQEKIIATLSETVGLEPLELKNILGDIDRFSFRPVPVLEDLGREELLAVKAKLNDLPGFRLEHNFKRSYIAGGIFSHILGYTGRVSEADIKKNKDYLLTEVIGKDGLEYQYDKNLRGGRGITLIETKARGGIGRTISSQSSRAGNNLVLFIDIDLQEKLTQVMKATLAATGLIKGAAVALDPKSGGVLALQSFPLFDGGRLKDDDYKNIFTDADRPLFNRAISGLYPPGSTAKPFLGVAALQEGIVDDKTTIMDTGSITVGSQIFKGWTVLGIVDIYKAIAMSSNIFFYTVGGGYGNIKGLGPEKIGDYFKRFGFASASGIDLPGEAAGLIPGPQWKRQTKKESWFIGDTYNISIGQGDVQVTPLQLAVATAAIANKGVLLKPRLVKSVTDNQGKIISSTQPEIIRQNFVDPKALAIIREAMHQTITSGSGRSLSKIPGSAGGKTGTAQTGIGNNTHAWFTVFAPYEEPKIVLTVLVENGGEGSSIAAPIARDVLEWYLNKN
ncbi:MAG: penicillin-binding protein 2 [Patescibacteria group bacterium]